MPSGWCLVITTQLFFWNCYDCPVFYAVLSSRPIFVVHVLSSRKFPLEIKLWLVYPVPFSYQGYSAISTFRVEPTNLVAEEGFEPTIWWLWANRGRPLPYSAIVRRFLFQHHFLKKWIPWCTYLYSYREYLQRLALNLNRTLIEKGNRCSRSSGSQAFHSLSLIQNLVRPLGIEPRNTDF